MIIEVKLHLIISSNGKSTISNIYIDTEEQEKNQEADKVCEKRNVFRQLTFNSERRNYEHTTTNPASILLGHCAWQARD